MSDAPLLRVAAKATILNDKGQVLIIREASTGLDNTKVGQWGLVGGRLEPGESFLTGLQREVLEETGLKVQVDRPVYVGEWNPVIREVPHQIIAIFMLCHAKSTAVRLSEEHNEYLWIDMAARQDYQLMEPDNLVLDALDAML